VPEVRYVTCRQEGGAAMMADAYGRLTGRPGIAFATRGPGATNASAGVHIAQQDSTPMILLVGQIARDTAERDTFQEVDYRQFFGGMAKWVAQVEDAARLPEFLHRAFMTATSGRPGPVVLSLPEDMLTDRAGAEDGRPWRRVEAAPSPEALAALRRMLGEAERPFVILGGGGWDAASTGRPRPLPRRVRAAGRGRLPPPGPAGQRPPILRRRHRDRAQPEAGTADQGCRPDLALGSRLSEMTTQGYSLLGVPPRASAWSTPTTTPRSSAASTSPTSRSPPAWASSRRPWRPCRRRGPALGRGHPGRHADYLAWREPVPNAGALQMAEVVRTCGPSCRRRDRLQRGRQLQRLGQPLLPLPGLSHPARPVSGSMGYGLPAAIAAKLVHPGREASPSPATAAS
jgi:acetolactate synthase-1/2/3 large subunit